MKRNPFLAGTAALLILSLGLATVPPSLGDAQTTAARPIVRNRFAESAVRQQILDHFPDPSGATESFSDDFSRRAIQRSRAKSQYTLAFVEFAPEGVVLSDKQFPFEIYDQPAYAKAAPAVLLWGYVAGAVVMVYEAKEFKYVAAAEHTFIKPHLPAGPKAQVPQVRPSPRPVSAS